MNSITCLAHLDLPLINLTVFSLDFDVSNPFYSYGTGECRIQIEIF